MKTLFAAAILASMAVVPAFAMDDMSCKDFNAMDQAGQMKTVADMHGSMASDTMKSDDMKAGGKGAMTTGGSMAPDNDAMAQDVAAACKSSPDMMVGEAMKKSSMK